MEEGTADSDQPSQRHHSIRNPRIGSGFNNKPDDPVQIVDEEDADSIVLSFPPLGYEVYIPP